MNQARDDDATFSGIERILHDRIGLDVTTVGRSHVQRAVERRMAVCSERRLQSYTARLAADAQELQELTELVVVPETYFFREPEALDALALLLSAGSLQATPEAPLRVLSAPCSTGEEPYSIAIMLLAAGVPAAALAIDGMDVSLEAVGRARRATYRSPSFRGGSFDWSPYFDARRDELVLHDAVRSMVRIAHGNLVAGDFRAPRDRYDVVFCRNLLIYFDTEVQSRVIATLATLLAPDGILVVGAADTFAVRRAGFAPVPGTERAFLFRRLTEPVRTSASSAETAGTARLPVRALRPKISPARRPRLARARPGAVVETQAPDVHAASDEDRATVTRLANEGRLADAIRVGETALAERAPTAELLALMGTTYAALQRQPLAEACYRRALYLDPSHEEALLHLALLLEGRGDEEGARRLRARARRGSDGARGGTT